MTTSLRNLNRIRVWSQDPTPFTRRWQTWVPPTFAANPAEALTEWDPNYSTSPQDYDYLGIFGDCDWDTREEALAALQGAEQEGTFANPRTSPVDHF